MVRSTIDNAAGTFKPEMFASVTIYTDDGDASPAVPRTAVIQDAESTRVWVVVDESRIELRKIKVGGGSRNFLQVLEGLKPGEKVVTKGAIFIDQAAGS
jgi:cobalt-zinc-cadmium efflux system membrane fusion protein